MAGCHNRCSIALGKGRNPAVFNAILEKVYGLFIVIGMGVNQFDKGVNSGFRGVFIHNDAYFVVKKATSYFTIQYRLVFVKVTERTKTCSLKRKPKFTKLNKINYKIIIFFVNKNLIK